MRTCLALVLLMLLSGHADAQSRKTLKAVRAALTAIVASAYQAPSPVTIGPGLCDCQRAFCTQPTDLVITCGAVLEPSATNAYLTQTAEGGFPSGPVGCAACACNNDPTPVTLLALATCVHTQ